MYPCSSPMPPTTTGTWEGHYTLYLMPPQQQQPGKGQMCSHAPTHPQTMPQEGVTCPSHSLGPTTTVTPWEGLPPKRQGRQVVQQMPLVVDDPVLLGLLHGVDVNPLAHNLVWLVGGDHIPSLLRGGDQFLHAVKVEEGDALVIEDFAHVLPIL